MGVEVGLRRSPQLRRLPERLRRRPVVPRKTPGCLRRRPRRRRPLTPRVRRRRPARSLRVAPRLSRLRRRPPPLLDEPGGDWGSESQHQ